MNIPIVTPKYFRDSKGTLRRFDKLPTDTQLRIIKQLEQAEIKKLRERTMEPIP